MKKVAAGEACHRNFKRTLEQYSNEFFDGEYGDEVYISGDYGQYMAYFVATNCRSSRRQNLQLDVSKIFLFIVLR